MEKYELLSQIGEGSFGQVYKAKTRGTDEIVAVKIIRKRGRSCKELKSLRQECEIQKYLSHPNIVRMKDSFETIDEIVVVTEYADKELYEILGKTGRFSEECAQKIICDLVSALYYLHSNRVLHRDLKPQNVLLESNGIAKLCDFGFARIMSTRTHVLTSIKGTPLYMAPELIEECPYDHNADLWSLGCIAYEMIVGTPPFQTTSILHLVRLIRFESIKWPDFISPTCRSFLQGLLQKIPSQRLTWPDLLEHPFVKNRILIIDSPTSFTAPLSSSQAHAKQQQFEHLSMRALDKSHAPDNPGCVSQPIYPLINRFHPFVSADAYTSRQNGTSSGSTASVDVLLSNLSLRASLQSDLLSADQSGEVNCTDSACQSQQFLSISDNINNIYDNFTDEVKYRDGLENISKESPCQDPETDQDLDQVAGDCNLKKLPDWDAKAVDQHIENEEWLAFLQQSIEEVIEGEITSLVEETCVSIFVSPLRNSTASSQVVEYIACLLSLPFVVKIDPEDLVKIKRVYYKVKVVPNLICAMNIILQRLKEVRSEDDDCAKTAAMLSPEQLQALESSMLVLCRLVHSEDKFLVQFCQAVDIVNGVTLLRELLSLEKRKVRIVADSLAILNNILRLLPANIELVEKVVFGERESHEQLSKLLTHSQSILKTRTCTLIRLLGRLRSKFFKQIWDKQLESLLRTLANDDNESVKNIACRTIDELVNC
ncbi:serine/threonine-protein kinase fused [Microplitis demolitor]|uniref:serine/threonine-protein kinase fused n=1 Tax=Microplitis demolitor TaxID=69319 RepID=UPI0004CDAE4A|nr:serine/threonine-protein kinase fused [Microplitis demolitor]